jgi:hypothetical protein
VKTDTKINNESYKKALIWLTATWQTLLVSVIAIIFLSLATSALYPKLDSASIDEGMAKVKELNIRFDTKLISELESTKQPSEIKASGGRDPFAGY